MIPADVSRCIGARPDGTVCPLRGKCERYLDIGNERSPTTFWMCESPQFECRIPPVVQEGS